MKQEDLNTTYVNTWCPGCPNNGILTAVKQTITELVNDNKIKLNNIVTLVGIGCHAKIYDYLNLNSFYSIHGRLLPTALGIKLANQELIPIGFGGDGDTYAEGLAHFIHACRYNVDMTMLVHTNQVFALTTGQATPVTEKNFKDGSTPLGVKETPLNPLNLALVSGATFIARSYALDVAHLTSILKEAILHKGFSFVDILQPCITFHNTTSFFNKHIYKLKNHDSSNYNEALKKASEWDYNLDEKSKIPIGIFYKIKKLTYEQEWPQLKKPFYLLERKPDYKKILDEFR